MAENYVITLGGDTVYQYMQITITVLLLLRASTANRRYINIRISSLANESNRRVYYMCNKLCKLIRVWAIVNRYIISKSKLNWE